MLVNTVIAVPGGDLAQRLGIPAVWAIHESYEPPVLWWMQGASLHPEVRRRADAALWNAASAFFEAEATRRQYADHVPPGRSLTLPFGIDLEEIDAARARFDRAAARRVRKVPEHAKVVLCVGTVEPRKAQVPLVQAFGLIADRHPDARLVFVGGRDDADTLALREYVAACGPRERVTVVPIIPEVWPWYGLADLVVCASDVESLPRSVLESMAFETPVLATSVFGLPELIEHGETGWLCPPRDVRALADALDRALGTSDAERRRIGAAARELVRRRHALGPYAAGVTELLSQAVAGESAPVAGVRAE
jgi:glycosyltransferase involved in cell wall biosynthesis